MPRHAPTLAPDEPLRPADAALATLLPLLDRGRWFAGLPPALRADLLAAGRLLRLQPGELLFRRGDANAGLYGVLYGAIRIGALAPDGREAVLGVVETAQWFGEIALFDGGPRTHDAQAVGATRLLWVPRERIEALLAAEPGHWRHLGGLLAEKIRAVFMGLEELALLPAPARVARRLLAMAQGHGMLAPGLAHRQVAVTQAQLGAMLALSRQTVSEVLRGFEARGWLARHHGGIELKDVQALQRAGEGPA